MMRRNPLMSRPGRAIAIVVAASTVLSGCGFHGLYSAPLPGGANLGDHPYQLKIEFSDVLDLVPQSSVKVNDVPVGKVTAISLGDDHGRWVADTTISVNGSVKLPADARASVLQTSLLGEKYISLQMPTAAEERADYPQLGAGQDPPPLKNGDRIPISRTNSAPEAEQVLGALSLLLNEGGLRQIKSIAMDLNQALAGKDRQDAIRDLLNQLNTFVGTLDNQKDEITSALDQINALASTLNQQKKIITDALDTFPQALKVLSDDRTKLVTLLSSLSNLGSVATRVIDATQTQLVQSLKLLDPVVTQLSAAGDALPQSLRILLSFPFPIGVTRQIVKGDYANLDAVLNLNLTDELCGLLGLCAGGASSLAQKVGLSALSGLIPNGVLGTLVPGGLVGSSNSSGSSSSGSSSSGSSSSGSGK